MTIPTREDRPPDIERYEITASRVRDGLRVSDADIDLANTIARQVDPPLPLLERKPL